MILLVLNADESLNDCRVIYRCEFVNFFGLILNFFRPIKLPISFANLLQVTYS
jgi:hypothetical protein